MLAAAAALWLMTGFAAFGQQMPAEYDQFLKTLGKQGDFNYVRGSV
jgi:hypothetical protein